MLENKIMIDEMHVEIREGLVKKGFALTDIRTRMFHSFDHDHLEKQVNKFLEDAIYVTHMQRNLKCDISKIEEFSGDGLYNYVVILEYINWPF